MQSTKIKIEPRIATLGEKMLVGMRMRMSLNHNRTTELWRSFMPRRKEITNNLGSELISLQVYDPAYFEHFDPTKEFEKWAAVEVADFNRVPPKMETFVLTSGAYAVFDYKGPNTDHSIFDYIFSSWLPNSNYRLDDRPHFEILGDRYRNGDPDSEEEIWVPVR